MGAMDDLYETACTEGVTIDRTGRGLLHLAGEQRVWFLQNTITADIDDLAPGKWRESFFLTPKGKVVSHFRVGATPGDLWADVDPPTQDLADWFVRYRFRTKVEIEDRSTSVMAVVGPAARELASDGEVIVRDDAVIFGSRLGDVDVADVHGAIHSDLPSAPLEVYEMFRIEAGVPLFGTDYTDANLPQEAGLTRIVPVDKGCYVGQETVARIHFRGHINKSVRPLSLEGVEPDAARGRQLLRDGEPAGAVTSATRTPQRGVVAIGMIRVDIGEGAELDVEGGGAAIAGPIPEGTKVKR